jgi:transposase
MNLLLTELLNLPGVMVEDFRQTETELFLEVEVYTAQATCPRCNQISSNLHQNHWLLVRDLPISNRTVWLKVNRRQFKCITCQKPFSEKLDFLGKRRKYTDRYACEIVQQVVHSDVHNVAKNNDLSDAEVWSMVNYVADLAINIDLTNLKRLGIDEISLVKGLGKFIVVLVDLDQRKPIGFVKSRTQVEISKVMRAWGETVLLQIEEVSIDMSGNYKGIAQKILPNADVTVDRFHVTKIVHSELNAARVDVRQSALTIPAAAERARILGNTKGSKYVLLKAESELNEQQKVKLEQVKEVCPRLAVMHGLKEEFTQLFDQAKNLGDGTLKLLDWLVKSAHFFPRSVKTIKRWFGEIVGYFERHTNNGLVEGINNKLKLIKRSGFGFTNWKNFETRCLLNWYFHTYKA